MGLLCFFRFECEVLLGIEPDVLQHHNVTGFHRMHGLAGMAPEDAIDIEDRFAQQLFKFLRVGLERGKVFFPGPALVGDDHDPAFFKGTESREMLPEALVIKNKICCGVDWGVEVQPEEDCFSFSSQVLYRSNRHRYTPEKVTLYSGI